MRKSVKYTSLSSFEKHLQQAAPQHFCPVYFLIGKDEFQRKDAEATLLEYLTQKKGAHVISFDAEDTPIESMMQELFSLSFFAQYRIVCVRHADKYNKEAISKLENYFDSPSPRVFLILSAASLNRTTKFYRKGEKVGVILEFQEQKFWEKEKDLTEKIVKWVNRSEKSIDLKTARFLLQFVGAQQDLLETEMDKLLCYVADQPSIGVADIEAICNGTNTKTAWQLGDAIFRRDGAMALKICTALFLGDTSLISLIRQLRFQFQSKLQLANIIANGGGPAEIQQSLPYMKGEILKKNIDLASAYGQSALKSGVLAIDQAERVAKSSAINWRFLVDQLILKLVAAK